MELYAVQLLTHPWESKKAIVRAQSQKQAVELTEKAGYTTFGDEDDEEGDIFGVTLLDKYNKVNTEVIKII